jgi:high-affinity Fe2+/Pb2+ permease
VSPRTADLVRKALGLTMAVALTVLLFRVLGRLAEGRQRLFDIELFAAVALAALGFWWVRWARRVSASRPWREIDGDPREPQP